LKTGSVHFKTIKRKIGAKTFPQNCAQSICLEIKAGRIAAKENQRGKKEL